MGPQPVTSYFFKVRPGVDDRAMARTIEAAMPWSELCAQPPDDRTVWALGLQRVIPGTGFQSWSQPADPAVTPTGFGLLRFR